MNVQTVALPDPVEVARCKCINALRKATFKDISVSADGHHISAPKWVSTQWTRTPMSVTLTPQDPGTLVTVASEAGAQSLASAIRSPSEAIERKFLKALADS